MKPLDFIIDMKVERERHRKTVNRFNIGIFFLYVIFIFFGVYCYNWYSYRGPTEIDYSRLSESETEYARSLMNQIDEEFILASKSIMFTRNKSDIAKNNNKEDLLKKGYSYIGENWITRKEIKVYLTMDEENDLETIIHELAHSFVVSKNDEYFVKEMESKGVGLKNKDRMRMVP